ncbi:MAG TPA: hypothetical protein VGM85_06995 [Paraburkholderia sp.]|jgi:hypothetical protein
MTFVDQEIAHITHAMALSLQAPSDSGLPVFPAAYWRKRLRELIDRYHLEYGQLCAVDALLLQVERVGASRRWAIHAPTAA